MFKRNNVLRKDTIILETELAILPKVQLDTNIELFVSFLIYSGQVYGHMCHIPFPHCRAKLNNFFPTKNRDLMIAHLQMTAFANFAIRKLI